MSNGYQHPVYAPGETLNMTLAELLAQDAEPRDTERLGRELEAIRDAERAAEVEGATVRLY
jgi:hypothetical protein